MHLTTLLYVCFPSHCHASADTERADRPAAANIGIEKTTETIQVCVKSSRVTARANCAGGQIASFLCRTFAYSVDFSVSCIEPAFSDEVVDAAETAVPAMISRPTNRVRSDRSWKSTGRSAIGCSHATMRVSCWTAVSVRKKCEDPIISGVRESDTVGSPSYTWVFVRSWTWQSRLTGAICVYVFLIVCLFVLCL